MDKMETVGISLYNDYCTSDVQGSPVTMSSNTSVTEPLQISPPSRKAALFETPKMQQPQQFNFTYDTDNNYQRTEVENAAQSAALREKLIHAFRLNRKKQLTLERINKYNMKLMEELKTPRIKASNCALMVIDFTEQHNDPLLPEIWGAPEHNPFRDSVSVKSPQSATQLQFKHSNTPRNGKHYHSDGNNGKTDSEGCCIIM